MGGQGGNNIKPKKTDINERKRKWCKESTANRSMLPERIHSGQVLNISLYARKKTEI